MCATFFCLFIFVLLQPNWIFVYQIITWYDMSCAHYSMYMVFSSTSTKTTINHATCKLLTFSYSCMLIIEYTALHTCYTHPYCISLLKLQIGLNSVWHRDHSLNIFAFNKIKICVKH